MSDSSPSRSSEGGTLTLARRLRDWLGLRGRGEETLREELEELLEGHAEDEEGGGAEERTLLRNVLSVTDLHVDDVMVPNADIVALDADSTLDQVIAKFIEAGHSRLPVYRETLDDVIGMIHVKDLLPYWNGKQPFTLDPVLRKVLFVPPSVPVLDLLLQMRGTGLHMALVVDEYGGVDGLVTIEDLVEQIVGEIRDEHDEDEGPFLIDKADGSVEALGRCPVDELVKRVGRSLLDPEQEEQIDTLGGLVFSLVGRVPRRGELIPHPSGLQFEVLDADARRVKRIRIRNLDSVPPAPTGK
jgi:CBS domain containing-hemolysin-like protein